MIEVVGVVEATGMVWVVRVGQQVAGKKLGRLKLKKAGIIARGDSFHHSLSYFYILDGSH